MTSEDALWSFAVERYARPGVAARCLSLQADGADVCLLLCGLWLEHRGVPPSDERAAALQLIASGWQREVVTPLRQLRQAWRGSAATDPVLAGLREQVKALELEAERELLGRLEHAAAPWPPASAAEGWLERLTPGQDDALAALRRTAG